MAGSRTSFFGAGRLSMRRWRQRLPSWLDQQAVSESSVILFTSSSLPWGEPSLGRSSTALLVRPKDMVCRR